MEMLFSCYLVLRPAPGSGGGGAGCLAAAAPGAKPQGQPATLAAPTRAHFLAWCVGVSPRLGRVVLDELEQRVARVRHGAPQLVGAQVGRQRAVERVLHDAHDHTIAEDDGKG